MADIIIMKTSGLGAPKPEAVSPDPAKLIKGTYKTRAWNHFTGENGRLYCGIWESTPGKVSVSYDEWEFCHIISGKAVLANDKGKTWAVKRGDAFIIPAGFKGTWETVAKLRKHYVILMPKAQA
jgi:uncharacterized protein